MNEIDINPFLRDSFAISGIYRFLHCGLNFFNLYSTSFREFLYAKFTIIVLYFITIIFFIIIY